MLEVKKANLNEYEWAKKQSRARKRHMQSVKHHVEKTELKGLQ